MNNAEVDYIDAKTGTIIETVAFYDPGLDPESEYAKEQMRSGKWNGPHLAYACGRPLGRVVQ